MSVAQTVEEMKMIWRAQAEKIGDQVRKNKDRLLDTQQAPKASEILLTPTPVQYENYGLGSQLSGTGTKRAGTMAKVYGGITFAGEMVRTVLSAIKNGIFGFWNFLMGSWVRETRPKDDRLGYIADRDIVTHIEADRGQYRGFYQPGDGGRHQIGDDLSQVAKIHDNHILDRGQKASVSASYLQSLGYNRQGSRLGR